MSNENENQFEFEKVEGGYSLVKYTGDEANIVVPDRYEGEPVIMLGENSFANNLYLETILIPDAVTLIAARAFWSCTQLQNVILPKSIMKLGRRVFDGCSSLTSIHLPPNLRELPSGLFQYCKNLKKIVIPNNIDVIADTCFFHCHSLSQLTFSNQLRKIKAQAFAYCHELTEVSLPSSLIELGEESFSQCTNLNVVSMGSDKVLLKGKNFKDCNSLEKISFPLFPTLYLELQYKFSIQFLNHWDSLLKDEKAELLNSLKRKKALRLNVFEQNNPKLIAILIQEKIKLSLEEFDIYLESSIQNKDTAITAMLLEYKKESYDQNEIDDHQTHLDYLEIGIEHPTFSELKKNWAAIKNINKEVCIMGYIGKKDNATIPSSLKDGTSIIMVGKGATDDYSNLKIIEISSGITCIFSKCFSFCEKLEEITLPDTLVEIESCAFLGCTGLVEIFIPSSVKTICADAFFQCENLEKIIFSGEMPEITKGISHFPLDKVVNIL